MTEVTWVALVRGVKWVRGVTWVAYLTGGEMGDMSDRGRQGDMLTWMAGIHE